MSKISDELPSTIGINIDNYGWISESLHPEDTGLSVYMIAHIQQEFNLPYPNPVWQIAVDPSVDERHLDRFVYIEVNDTSIIDTNNILPESIKHELVLFLQLNLDTILTYWTNSLNMSSLKNLLRNINVIE